MDAACVRPLGDYDTIGRFLEHFSDIPARTVAFDRIQKRMGNIEELLVGIEKKQTLDQMTHRCSSAKSETDRMALRKRVVDELYEFPRPTSEKEILLGTGGARPQTALLNNMMAIIVIGLPGSGKSTVSDYLSDKFGAIMLDPDMAKRKLPEFEDNDVGADLTHDESKTLIFGDSHMLGESLLQKCLLHRDSVVIQKIGDERNSFHHLAEAFFSAGYRVHLVLVRANRETVIRRIIKRFQTTGRYVPLGMVYDKFSNNPTITYYDALEELWGHESPYESFLMIRNDDHPIIDANASRCKSSFLLDSSDIDGIRTRSSI
ncbi:MAG: zeta toxin family protein [Bacillota bacterium]|nr:zeta toxin family protein [Bacillota bacterium]